MVFRPPFFLPWFYRSLLWRIPTQKKELYLTFDDGPIPGPTEFVLHELEKANAKATFFCIGDNVSKYPDVFRQIPNAGHTYGNHTYHHMKGWNHTTEHYIEDIQLCEEEFNKSDPTGWGLRETINQGLFRPPYGRIRRRQIQALTDYKIVMWDVLTHDYAKHFSPEECLRGSIRAARPGSIIVFHDSIKAEQNMSYALPRLIDHFGGLGYVFKAIPNS